MICTPFDYFLDPTLRASTWGCVLLGASSGLLGSLLTLRHACLMAETMSHASYPGLMLAVLVMSFFPFSSGSVDLIWLIDLVAILGACLGSLVGIYFYSWMLKRNIKSDSALCWVLSSFLGLGVLMASRLQIHAPRLYQRAQGFLYGQAATLSDFHVAFFLVLLILTCLTLFLAFRSIKIGHFDPLFAKTQNLYPKPLRIWVYILTVTVVVIGIRAGGVLVMSALLVAPAVSAKFLSHSFLRMLLVAFFLGALMGYFGNMASLELDSLAQGHLEAGQSLLPTGPAIALLGFFSTLGFILLAPGKGALSKFTQLRKQRLIWLEHLRESKPYREVSDGPFIEEADDHG